MFHRQLLSVAVLTQIIREASTVEASWRYKEMWHFGDRMDERESGDRESISLKGIHVPRQLLVLERVMLMHL